MLQKILENDIEIIFCSPLTRSLETIQKLRETFFLNQKNEKKIEKNEKKSFPKVVCLPFIRERLTNERDTGLEREQLLKLFPFIDFSLLHQFFWFESHSNNKLQNIVNSVPVNPEPLIFSHMRCHNLLLYLSFFRRETKFFVFSHKFFLSHLFDRLLLHNELLLTHHSQISSFLI